jgi:hypothetical protein
MSEALREEEGRDQIQHEGAGDDETDDVGRHRRSTPRTMSATSANIPIVSSTNTTSMRRI